MATSIRSGARDTTICTGRFRAIRIGPEAEASVEENNTVLPQRITRRAPTSPAVQRGS